MIAAQLEGTPSAERWGMWSALLQKTGGSVLGARRSCVFLCKNRSKLSGPLSTVHGILSCASRDRRLPRAWSYPDTHVPNLYPGTTSTPAATIQKFLSHATLSTLTIPRVPGYPGTRVPGVPGTEWWFPAPWFVAAFTETSAIWATGQRVNTILSPTSTTTSTTHPAKNPGENGGLGIAHVRGWVKDADSFSGTA
eukprot:3553331-Rhodomonas_salina.2